MAAFWSMAPAIAASPVGPWRRPLRSIERSTPCRGVPGPRGRLPAAWSRNQARSLVIATATSVGVPRRSSRSVRLSTIFLMSSGSNKVLLRMLVRLVAPYTFFLGATQNLMYIIAFGLQLKAKTATSSGGQAELLAASKSFVTKGAGTRLLAGSGLCEAIAYMMLHDFASQLPGSLIPVMSQGLLLFSMIWSYILLGRRYDGRQVLGVVVVVLGVVICSWPNLSSQGVAANASLLNCIGLFGAYAFIASSLVLKEYTFARFRELHKGHSLLAQGSLSLETVNLASSLWSGLALIFLWPLNYALLHAKLGILAYLSASLSAFSAAGPLLGIYLAVNLVYTAVTTIVVERLSTVVFLLINVLNVPLVSLAFCMNLPVLGAETFRWSFLAGLAVIITGLLTYNSRSLRQA